MVDDQRQKGTMDKIKGTVKEQYGKMTGDKETEAKGKAEKNEGKVRDTVGKGKDKVRDAVSDKDSHSPGTGTSDTHKP